MRVEYKLVRVEAPPRPHEGQLVCTSCGGPLRAREGRFALKYFRVGGSVRYPLRPRKMAPRVTREVCRYRFLVDIYSRRIGRGLAYAPLSCLKG